MTSDNRQLEALYQALLSAFPTEGELERMLRFGMAVNLPEIASGNLSNQVFAVVRFAEARGLLPTLVESALAASPNNAALRALPDYRTLASGTPVASSPRPAMSGDPVALRNAIQRAYGLEELQLLCADIQERCRARGHDIRLSIDDLGGTTKPVKVLNLIEFLDRRRLLDVLVETVREQRPGSL